MKKTKDDILSALRLTPDLLRELLHEFDGVDFKIKPEKNKWSVHEHATHIAIGERFGFHIRMQQFLNEEFPEIQPLSGASFPADFFLKINLSDALNEFLKNRDKTVELAMVFPEHLWNKKASHPEYKKYTPFIMLRHLLMHDLYHLYKIEDLLLSTVSQQKT